MELSSTNVLARICQLQSSCWPGAVTHWTHHPRRRCGLQSRGTAVTMSAKCFACRTVPGCHCSCNQLGPGCSCNRLLLLSPCTADWPPEACTTSAEHSITSHWYMLLQAHAIAVLGAESPMAPCTSNLKSMVLSSGKVYRLILIYTPCFYTPASSSVAVACLVAHAACRHSRPHHSCPLTALFECMMCRTNI